MLGMTRMAVLSDEMWAQIEGVLPPVKGAMGRPMRDHRLLVEGAIYRYRTGVAGGTCRRTSVRGRRSGSAITGSRPTGPGTRFCPRYRSRLTPAARSTGGSQSTRPHRGFISTVPPQRGRRASPVPTQGAGSSYKDPSDRVAEPEDHAIGRSRGGLTTKTHALVDGNGMPLVIAVTLGRRTTPRRCRSSLRSCGLPGSDLAVRGRRRRAARGQGLLSAWPPGAPALTGNHRGDPRTFRPDPAPQEQGLTRRPTRRLRRQRLQEPQRRRASASTT